MSHADEAVPERTQQPVTRAGAVRFVIVFLALTFLFLIGGRYAVNTLPMNWYLFQVARQTCWVLNLLGDSCSLENTEPYRNRGGLLRAEMAAWRAGREPEPGEVHPDTSPPSAYEVWLHRGLRLKQNLAVEKRYHALTDPIPPTADVSAAGRLAHVRQSLDRLAQSTERSVGGRTAPVMAPGLDAVITSSREFLSGLEQGKIPSTMPVEQAVQELAAQVDRGRLGQRAFLEERITALTTQIQDHLGPLVNFVAGGSAEKPRRFSFHLVPDCGALPSMSIYLAALLAFPATMRKRLVGLAVGLPVLYAINVARLTCLAMIGAWANDPDVFEFAHQYVWQALYILIVVGVWLLWVELIVRPEMAWRAGPTSPA